MERKGSEPRGSWRKWAEMKLILWLRNPAPVRVPIGNYETRWFLKLDYHWIVTIHQVVQDSHHPQCPVDDPVGIESTGDLLVLAVIAKDF